MSAAQLKAETVAALKALPVSHRDAVVLTCCYGLLECEAAQVMGLTPHHFRSILASAFKQLSVR